jgi:hypothetical protein
MKRKVRVLKNLGLLGALKILIVTIWITVRNKILRMSVVNKASFDYN